MARNHQNLFARLHSTHNFGGPDKCQCLEVGFGVQGFRDNTTLNPIH